MIYNSDSLGFRIGEDCTEALISLSEIFTQADGDTVIQFQKGDYYISSEKCREVYRAITNTAAENEYKDKSRINIHKVPFLFEGVNNLIFDGNGSHFIVDGKVTNMIISSCDNIVFRNFTLKTINPNLHRFTVVKTSAFKTVFRLNKESVYKKENGKYVFIGNGFHFGFTEGAKFSSWNIIKQPGEENAVLRGLHPFKDAISIKEIGDFEFSVRYALPKKFSVGQSFHIYDCLRSEVGIFCENSRNIKFENVHSNFNYSLAFVAQGCENLVLEDCVFAPENGSEIDISSLADFIQICMCKGKIEVNNCVFDGAGDDAINVHGMHFKIKDVEGDSFTAVFGHPQTWGFNPFSVGDEIEFIDPKTLLSEDSAAILSSELVSDHEIRIRTDRIIPTAYDKYVIENVTLCPELLYENNTIKNVVTRGILYTSRGRCVIRNNRFIDTGMSSILLSDDAESWFESGMCKDVTIENNIFEKSGKNTILILPENKENKGTVHSNINIIGNTFNEWEGDCILAKSTENLFIKDNLFYGKEKLKTENCVNIKTDL